MYIESDARACITSPWLSLLTENFQLTINFITEIRNADSCCKVLSTSADPVNFITILGKIECVIKSGYSIK